MPETKHSYCAIIVKPTYDCNLSCSYCSVEVYDTYHRMSLQTEDKLFERVTDYCGSKLRTINALQTNASLFSDEFIDVISEHRFRVCTSIDGSAELHDRSRKDGLGNSTFNRVKESVALLKDRGVPAGAITVLNRINKDYMPDIYSFFGKAQIHLRINPAQLHGKVSKNYEDVTISP